MVEPGPPGTEQDWVSSNRSVIEEAFSIFLEIGEWPKVDDLDRLLASRYQDVDVQDIVDSKPHVPGEARQYHQSYLTLAIRHLRYVPRATPLLYICLAAARQSAKQFRRKDGELNVSSTMNEVSAVAGGDDLLLLRAGQLLARESATPVGPGGGPTDGGWTYSVNGKMSLKYEKVFSPDDFVKVQDEILGAYAERHPPYLAGTAAAFSDSSNLSISDDVFVVHGHGGERSAVADVIRELTGRAPIILQERLDRGSPTVIEKLERESTSAGFAVVIFTGDDEGRVRPEEGSTPAELQLRARQNVVAELGFFIGKLGRDRVKVLYEPGVEVPSDFSGITYLLLDTEGHWQGRLIQELEAMGVPAAQRKNH